LEIATSARAAAGALCSSRSICILNTGGAEKFIPIRKSPSFARQIGDHGSATESAAVTLYGAPTNDLVSDLGRMGVIPTVTPSALF
jgi:hypothetical protein